MHGACVFIKVTYSTYDTTTTSDVMMYRYPDTYRTQSSVADYDLMDSIYAIYSGWCVRVSSTTTTTSTVDRSESKLTFTEKSSLSPSERLASGVHVSSTTSSIISDVAVQLGMGLTLVAAATLGWELTIGPAMTLGLELTLVAGTLESSAFHRQLPPFALQ
jgi:hypothetical protein